MSRSWEALRASAGKLPRMPERSPDTLDQLEDLRDAVEQLASALRALQPVLDSGLQVVDRGSRSAFDEEVRKALELTRDL